MVNKKGRRNISIENVSGNTPEKYTPTDFSKIRVGLKTLEDAVLTLGDYKHIHPSIGNKK